MMDENIPILPTYGDPDGKFTIVWCDDCRRYHSHGPDAQGHRFAHCMDTPLRTAGASRYAETGYILEYKGTASVEMMHDLRRERPRGPPLTRTGV